MAATTADPFAVTATGESRFEPAEPAVIGRAPATGRERLEGSPQQEAFWAELLGGTSHVLLEARAGTGKSTSCREGMHRMLERDRSLAIRYCCFNKAIADDFAAKCPPGVDVGTMHRFGHEAMRRAFGSTLDQNKTYTLMDAVPGGSVLKRYVRKAVAQLVGLAKNSGLHPHDGDLSTKLESLCWQYDLETWGQLQAVVEWAAILLEDSADATHIIDFDDMLWMSSVVLEPRFPEVDVLFIDEAQDCNPVQHAMAERLCSSGRIVVVGDPYQSIYAFRGADSESMPKLRTRLDATVMPLTVTFRCPRKHVELARELVGDFEAAPSAPDGEVHVGGRDLVERAGPGDMVLCRANAPLVSACLEHIARRSPATMRGRAIGDSLVAVVRKVERHCGSATIAGFSAGLARWRSGEIDRLSARDGTENAIEAVEDKAACLEAIASSCSSPAEIEGVIGQLFSDGDTSTRVTFSSVHRAKGSEARNVTYIQVPFNERRDRSRPPLPWEVQQRKNLRYVALTRSMHRLNLVTL